MKKMLFLSFAFGLFGTTAIMAQWSNNGAPVCFADSAQNSVSCIFDDINGTIFAWLDRRNGNYDVYAQKFNMAGIAQWSYNGVPVCTTAGSKGGLAITSDESGGAIMVWSCGGNIYSQRINSSGMIQWPAGGVPICVGPQSKQWPKIISDDVGGAIICWQDYRNGNYDIFAQRINNLGQIQWLENGVAVCDTAWDQTLPEMAADGSGGAVITWKDNRAGSSSYSNVYIQKINNNGQRQWPVYGLALCTDPLDQWPLKVIGNNNAGFIVIWKSDYNAAIQGQRVDSMGNKKWGNYGVSIVSTTGQVSGGDLVSDGARGAIFTWGEFTNSYYKIKAQRIDSLGVKLWGANGLATSIDSSAQFNPRVVSDQAGGAIVSWYDWKHLNFDIYAQRIDFSGNRVWSDTGRAMCLANGDQQYQCMASNNEGGAIIAWVDSRNGNEDIYAQRVNSDGTVGVAGGPEAPALGGRDRIRISPNPVKSRCRISFNMVADARYLSIFDIEGRLVRQVAVPPMAEAVDWDGRNGQGQRVAAGVYLVRLEGQGLSRSAKVTLVR